VVDDNNIWLLGVYILYTYHITTHMGWQAKYHITDPFAYAVHNNSTLIEWVTHEEGYPR
jgi:hypothetical protein